MNLEADPLGYRLMSRQLSSVREAELDTAETLRVGVGWLKLGVIALVLISAGGALVLLYLARFVMVPVVAGIVVGFILGPIGDRGHERGIPRAATFSLLVVGVLAGIGVLGTMLLPAVQGVVEAMPQAAVRVSHFTQNLKGWIGALGSFATAPAADMSSANGTSGVEIASSAVTYLSPVLSQGLIFLFTLVLFLASRNETRQTIVMTFSSREHRLAALKTFSQIENRLADYFIAVTLVNIGVGIAVAAVFFALGVKGALTWGIVAFSLNFLPVVGPLLIKGALLAYGILVEPTLMGILGPFLAFLVISVVEANLITPRIVGDRITINPLLVFFSVVFWTWLWGFAGAFLAMPLLAIASAVFAVSETTSRLPE